MGPGALLWGTFRLPPAWPCTVRQVWVSDGRDAARGPKACIVRCQELTEHQAVMTSRVAELAGPGRSRRPSH